MEEISVFVLGLNFFIYIKYRINIQKAPQSVTIDVDSAFLALQINYESYNRTAIYSIFCKIDYIKLQKTLMSVMISTKTT